MEQTELQKAVFSIPALLKKVDDLIAAKFNPIVPVEAATPQATPPQAPAAKGTDIKTKDGKTLTCMGDLAPGCDVMMDGQPAPDGNYEMEDGSMIIAQAGKIVDIQPAKADVQPEAQAATPVVQEAAPVASPTPTKVTKYTETIFDAHFAAYKELESTVASQNKIIDGLVKLVEQIADTPAEKSAFKKKDGAPAVKTGIDLSGESIAEYRKRHGL